MYISGLCLSLIIALTGALPVERIDFYPTDLQSNDLYDINGYDVRPYPYQIPTNPYYVYDVIEGRWIPRCSIAPSFNNHINDSIPPNIPQTIPSNGNHRRHGNQRQGFARPGHSATFDALRGAIAFG